MNMKKKFKEVISFLLNPRLLFCIVIAWMITNGWSYVMLGIGTYYNIGWMIAVASAYLAFLWLPISPEKIVTFAIAIGLLRLFFPNDQKTLAVLKRLQENTKAAIKNRKDKKKSKDNKEIMNIIMKEKSLEDANIEENNKKKSHKEYRDNG